MLQVLYDGKEIPLSPRMLDIMLLLSHCDGELERRPVGRFVVYFNESRSKIEMSEWVCAKTSSTHVALSTRRAAR